MENCDKGEENPSINSLGWKILLVVIVLTGVVFCLDYISASWDSGLTNGLTNYYTLNESSGNASDSLNRINLIFASALSNGNFITLVMSHIAEITLAVSALSIIILFAKFSSYGSSSEF